MPPKAECLKCSARSDTLWPQETVAQAIEQQSMKIAQLTDIATNYKI